MSDRAGDTMRGATVDVLPDDMPGVVEAVAHHVCDTKASVDLLDTTILTLSSLSETGPWESDNVALAIIRSYWVLIGKPDATDWRFHYRVSHAEQVVANYMNTATDSQKAQFCKQIDQTARIMH